MKGPYYDTRKASEFLSIPVTTMETWRNRKLGPPYVKIGRSVRYAFSDLERYMQTQEQVLALDSEEVQGARFGSRCNKSTGQAFPGAGAWRIRSIESRRILKPVSCCHFFCHPFVTSWPIPAHRDKLVNGKKWLRQTITNRVKIDDNGLQIRCRGVNALLVGFDSNALSPFFCYLFIISNHESY